METRSTLKSKSEELFRRAQRVIPGGSNQVHRLVDPFRYYSSGRGSKIFDVEGNEYLDYHCAYGPIILGRHYEPVDKAVMEAIEMGADLFGVGGTEIELRLHEKLVEHFPSAEMALLCTSGSEATTFALRAARAITGARKIIKFQGHYHGFPDSVLTNVISPADKIGKKDPGSAGILEEVIDQTIVLPWNDLEAVDEALRKHAGDIAAMILEPIPHNIGCVLPQEGYLKSLREMTEKHGVILIFDEVITGARHHLGGLQKLWNIIPDMTTLGKAIGNGYPIAAVCGKEYIMKKAASAKGGNVFFGGTYNGHPLGVAASLATFKELEGGRVYEHIFSLGEEVRNGLKKITDELGLQAYTTGFGSVFLTYFLEGPVLRYRDLLRNDEKTFLSYRRGLIERGIFMLPKNLKRNHITFSHTREDIERTLEASEIVLRDLTPK